MRNAQNLEYTFPAYTNATFAEDLCARLRDTTDYLEIECIGGFCLLPSCLAVHAPNLESFYVIGAAIENFKDIPASLSYLRIEASSVGLPEGGPITGSGIDVNGNVAWSEFSNYFTNLTSIIITGSSLKGSLPEKLHHGWLHVDLSYNQLSGEISSSIFLEVLPQVFGIGLYFDISHNYITGPISANWFAALSTTNFDAGSYYATFYLSFAYNLLSGPIPADLFHPFENRNAREFRVDMSYNNLDGGLAADLFPTNLTSTSPDVSAFFSLKLSHNGLTDALPDALFNFAHLMHFEFDLSSNAFNGQLPARLFADPWSFKDGTGDFVVRLNENRFIQSVPEFFFFGGLLNNATILRLVIDISDNRINGDLAPTLLYSYITVPGKRDAEELDEAHNRRDSSSLLLSDAETAMPQAVVALSAEYVCLAASNTLIEAPLPSSLFQYTPARSSRAQFVFKMAHTPIPGSLPPTLLDSVLSNFNGSSTIEIDFSFSSVSGSPPSQCWPGSSVTYKFSSTRLNDTIPETWQDCAFDALLLDNIPTLTSTLPPYILRGVSIFNASNTPLTGPMPFLNETQSGAVLTLSGTHLDFCSTAPSTVGFSGSCWLYNSTACDCLNYYAAVCETDCTSIGPSNSPLVPTATSGCNPNTRPSPQFTCLNGIWTAPTVNTSTLIVPPGTVVIIGNLTSITVIIKGVGSFINITGSVTNLTTIIIELTPEQASELGSGKVLQQLIVVNSTNGSNFDLSQVGVNARVKSGCKKVKAEKQVLNEGQVLAAYLSIDSSGCNRWWIILVSVVCALVLLAIIVIALLAAFYKPFRQKIRPFSGRRQQASNP